ncbi:hypothetical protein C8R46DRAFT_1237108 [Mycena filopes]|nr:hypothetical protein C8R46DRAFT_1237108 [Mycena filopes]
MATPDPLSPPFGMSPDFIKMREVITDNPHSWDEAWNKNLTPWDTGGIQPPLREVTQSGEVPLATTGRALVDPDTTRYISRRNWAWTR